MSVRRGEANGTPEPVSSGPGGSSGETTPWHALGPEEALARLDVRAEAGLSEEEAAARLLAHGPNEIARADGPHPGRIFRRQLAEPLVLVLLIAAAVSGGVWLVERAEPFPSDAAVILAIVAANALLGFFQEYRAEREVESLRAMTAPECTVRRAGRVERISSARLVPGDVLLLESGDRVPADARLIHTASLRTDESPLTGESLPVAKSSAAAPEAGIEVADRAGMVYLGTVVANGRAEAVVVATGRATEMGAVASLLERTDDEETPLQRDLSRVGRQLGWLVLAISAVVATAGVARAGTFSLPVVTEMVLFAVALAVAAIPEGLPAVVTAALALGVHRMAERHAIVRRLPAVETLGSATVICSDKTGTLTRNEMTVREVVLGTGREIRVGGDGWSPGGGFTEAEGRELPAGDPELGRLLLLAALDNDATLVARDGDRGWRVEGDPTEGALLVAVRKAGLDERELRQSHPRLGEIPFSSERQRMTTLHHLDDRTTAVVKGAPETILERCARIRSGGEVAALDGTTRRALLALDEELAGRALRTLALASGPAGDRAEDAGGDLDPAVVERDLVWEGLLGMIDPPRPGAAESVARARRAGVRTVLVTGDHLQTGLAVAREVGIAGPESPSMTGRELATLDDEELAAAVGRVSVYGRVRPEDKLRIVRALAAQGEVVAMTGDGVNDAPALKEAAIGVAMGVAGTDVARDASDMILADDDYSTIVGAIAEGRKIFDNLRRFIRYLLSSNAGEVLTMLAAILAGRPLGLVDPSGGLLLPLAAVQILWINLVTDGAPALALGVAPAEPGSMERPPRDAHETVIGGSTWGMIALVGVVMTAGTLFVLDAYLPGGLTELAVPGASAGYPAVLRARTAAFTTLMLFQMANVFNCLSPVRSVFRSRVGENRWLLGAVGLSLALHAAVIYWGPLQRAFETAPLSAGDWAFSTTVALSVVAVSEIAKLVARRSRARHRM